MQTRALSKEIFLQEIRDYNEKYADDRFLAIFELLAKHIDDLTEASTPNKVNSNDDHFFIYPH